MLVHVMDIYQNGQTCQRFQSHSIVKVFRCFDSRRILHNQELMLQTDLCGRGWVQLDSIQDRLAGIDVQRTFDLDGSGFVSTAVLRSSGKVESEQGPGFFLNVADS